MNGPEGELSPEELATRRKNIAHNFSELLKWMRKPDVMETRRRLSLFQMEMLGMIPDSSEYIVDAQEILREARGRGR